MRFSNCLLLACLASLALAVPGQAAEDTPEQAKAREALRQAMGNPGATQPAPAAPTRPAAPVTPPVVAVPAAAPVASDSEAIQKAREALRRKMAEIEAQQPGATGVNPATKPAPVNPPVVSAPPAATAPNTSAQEDQLRRALREAMQQAAPAQSVSPTSPTLDQTKEAAARRAEEKARMEAEAKARVELKARAAAEARERAEAERQARKEAELKKKQELAQKAEAKKAEAEAKLAAAKQAEQEAKARKDAESAAALEARQRQLPAAKPPVVAPLEFAPLSAPPLPITAEQQQKLADLLEQYKADKITPEQYHEQRAKILSAK